MSGYARDRGRFRASSPQGGADRKPATPSSRGSGRQRRANPDSVRDLVELVVKQASVGQGGRLEALRKAWLEAVGRETAVASRVDAFRAGVVIVEADSAALAQELSVYHKASLLKRLRQTTKLPITDLRVRVGGRSKTPG